MASASVPFSAAPPARLAAALADALSRDGRRAAWVDLPVSDRPEDADDQRAAIEALDLRASCGTLVCLGHPAFLLSHPDKRVWLAGALPLLRPGDIEALRSATRLFAPSASLATALGREHGLAAAALDPETEPEGAARRLTA